MMTALYIFIVLVASQRVPFRGFGGHAHARFTMTIHLKA